MIGRKYKSDFQRLRNEAKAQKILEKKKKKKEGKKSSNYFWLLSAFSAFFILIGTFLPIVEVNFEGSSIAVISVWIYGVGLSRGYSAISNFSTLVLGLILFMVGVLKLKIYNNGRREKQGKWFIRLLIFSIIEVISLFLSLSLIGLQKSFYAAQVEYTLPLDGVLITASMGYYLMLIGAILGISAAFWDIIFKYVIMKEEPKK